MGARDEPRDEHCRDRSGHCSRRGSFVPRRPRLPGMEAFEGKSIFCRVAKIESYRGKDVVVCGGGAIRRSIGRLPCGPPPAA